MRVRCCVSRNTIGLQLAWHHHLKIMWSSILCMRFLQPGTQPSFLHCIWEEFCFVLWCVFGEGSREAKIISRLVEGCPLPLWDILGEKRVLRCKIVLYLQLFETKLKDFWLFRLFRTYSSYIYVLYATNLCNVLSARGSWTLSPYFFSRKLAPLGHHKVCVLVYFPNLKYI